MPENERCERQEKLYVQPKIRYNRENETQTHRTAIIPVASDACGDRCAPACIFDDAIERHFAAHERIRHLLPCSHVRNPPVAERRGVHARGKECGNGEEDEEISLSKESEENKKKARTVRLRRPPLSRFETLVTSFLAPQHDSGGRLEACRPARSRQGGGF